MLMWSYLYFLWLHIKSKLLDCIRGFFLCLKLHSAWNFVAIDNFDLLNYSFRVFRRY